MVRTQIYLTPEQRQALASLAASAGKRQGELIREAIDRLIETEGAQRRRAVLRQTAGIWESRADLPDFAAARASWDRT